MALDSTRPIIAAKVSIKAALIANGLDAATAQAVVNKMEDTLIQPIVAAVIAEITGHARTATGNEGIT